MVQLYVGVCEKAWNYEAVTPFGYACISPVKGQSIRTHAKNSCYVPEGTKVIQDSGAFSDSWVKRLNFADALERQIAHAQQYKYSHMIEYRASYDLLIDEVWNEGSRTKRRWTVEAAENAVLETIAAAKYITHHRHGLKLVLSAQGVDAAQYLRCVKGVLPYFQDGDILGLGGWCIIGKMPAQMTPVFRETIREVIPFAAKQGIKRVHIWGVIYPKALGELLWMCDEYGVEVSTDSSGVSTKPCFGDWGYGDWRDNNYKVARVQERGKERIRHVQLTRDWLLNLRATQYYRTPVVPEAMPRQLSLFEVA